jgi:PKD repeat protein
MNIYQPLHRLWRKMSLLLVIFSAIMVVQMYHTATSVASTAGRIAYLQLDETDGPPYSDVEGSHNGLCASNCPESADGIVNGAQFFNGNDMGINIPAHTEFDWEANDSFTIEFWVKAEPGETCAASNEVMIGRVDGGSDMHWSLGCSSSSGQVRFELWDNNGVGVTLESTKVITTGVWHHVVGVRDGLNDVNYLFVDGIEVISATQIYSGNFTSASASLNLGYLGDSGHFKGMLDEVAIYNHVLPPIEIATHYYLARGYDSTCATPVRIMPLGDSITQGINSGESDASLMISYRKDLWDSLLNAGYDVTFVGSLINGEAYSNFNPYHEGHGGITAATMRNNVQGYLSNNPADVLLLHIGTNGLQQESDIDPFTAHVEGILDKIDEYDEAITVILARIINRRSYHQITTDFNDAVEAMALERIARGDKIIIVDMEDGAGIDYRSHTVGGDMWDNLHPHTYKTGFAKMAAIWLDALTGFLPLCDVAPAIVSPPVTGATVNEPYTYQVVATGSLPLTYALQLNPPDMLIDAHTGIISWTPVATGTFSVTVEVINPAGGDTQSFDISVVEPASPVFTSVPVTGAVLNHLYIYSVEASGSPPPTYTLSIYPTGMSVNADTGVISWTPTVTGTFDVQVEASNGVGSDTQQFNVTVAEAPFCPLDTISYWKLDETSGAIFTDSVGINHATCIGDSCPGFTLGQVNGALAFDGLDDGLNVDNHPSLDWGNGDSFSIEAWVKTGQDCSGNKVFVGKYSSNANWWLGCGNSDGQAVFSLRDSNNVSYVVTGSSTINDNQWHHLVAVRDSSKNENRIYVDGVLEGALAATYAGNFSNNRQLTIGFFNDNFYVSGIIDEIALYNRTLFAAEIQQHYNDGVAGQGYCSAAGIIPIIVSTPITEAVAGHLYTYDVHAVGNPPPTYTLTISPPDTDMTIDTASGLLSWTPVITGTFNVEVEAMNQAGADWQSFAITVVEPAAPEFVSLPPTVATVGQMYVYEVEVTGKPAPTFALTEAPDDMIIDATTGHISWVPTAPGSAPVSIQAISASGSATQAFTIEVSTALICPVDILSYWKLDESSGSTFADFVGGNHASCTGGSCPGFTEGRVNGALVFDGVDDGLDVAHDPTLNWGNGDSFSIEAWVKTSQNCSGNKVFVGKHSGAANWWLGCGGSSNNAMLYLRDSTGISVQLQGTSTINDGKWHHLVAIRDSSVNKNLLYVDGNLEGMVDGAYAGTFSNNQKLTIGYFNNQYRVAGVIDEVALYNKALTADAIEQHYENGLSGAGYCSEGTAPTITSTPVITATVGELYSYQVAATGSSPLVYTLTTAPDEMEIDETTGLITWEPVSPDTVNVTVQASNAAGTDDQSFTIEVRQLPTITSTPVTTATVGELYSYQVAATGSLPLVYTLTTAPDEMEIDETTGLITWEPVSLGTVNVTVQVSNTAGTDDQSFTIEVRQLPTITSTPVTTATVGQPYTYQVTAVGEPIPTYILVIRPSGMTIDETTGFVSWTPTSPGTFNVTVQAGNAAGTDDQSFTITVVSPPSAPPAGHSVYLPIIIK